MNFNLFPLDAWRVTGCIARRIVYWCSEVAKRVGSQEYRVVLPCRAHFLPWALIRPVIKTVSLPGSRGMSSSPTQRWVYEFDFAWTRNTKRVRQSVREIHTRSRAADVGIYHPKVPLTSAFPNIWVSLVPESLSCRPQFRRNRRGGSVASPWTRCSGSCHHLEVASIGRVI